MLKLNDAFEKVLDCLNQLAWFVKEEVDFRQVNMMNYSCPHIITITGVAYDEVTFECVTPVSVDLTRFRHETVQKRIIKHVSQRLSDFAQPFVGFAEKDGDIKWTIKQSYYTADDYHRVEKTISDILTIANVAKTMSFDRCGIKSLLGSDGFVLPVDNITCKFHTLATALKYLELFNYPNIDNILLATFLYNPTFRTILRNEGIEALIKYLSDSEPELRTRNDLWNSIKLQWQDLNYSFGKYSIKLIHTFDIYEMFGKRISGLNETIELLEYNTVAVELMYHGRWNGPLSAKDRYFEYPLLGKKIGHTPDYEIYITEPKHSKADLHIGQNWGEVMENTIFNRKDKYALCTFKNEIVPVDEMRSLLSMIEDSDGLVYESLREEHLPALCFIEKKPYMFLITSDL